MAILKRVYTTDRQERLIKGVNENIFVRAQEFNAVVDRVNSITDNDNVIIADTIGEYTAGSGVTVSDPLTGAESITSSSATHGVGYSTGAGGTVTQATNRTTAVTLNKVTGQITTNNTSLAAGGAATFTVNNSAVAATDVVVLSIQGGATTNQTNVRVTAVGAGTFAITVENNHATTAETGSIKINFAVIKAVNA